MYCMYVHMYVCMSPSALHRVHTAGDLSHQCKPFSKVLVITDYWFTDEGGRIVNWTSDLVCKSLGLCVSKLIMWLQLTVRVCVVIAGLHLQAPGVPVDGAGAFEWIVLLFYKWCPALCPSVTVHMHLPITRCICIHVCHHCHKRCTHKLWVLHSCF